MLPVPTITYLAQFSGRDESSFTTFADQALIQATLLFSITTQRAEYPDTEDGELLAINAILEMADRIYLEQPYAAVKAGPYSSESIGSYSYAKGSAAAKAKDGLPTGLFWWDLAVDELSLADRSLVTSGSVVGGIERELYVGDNDVRYIVGPADGMTVSEDISSELSPRPFLG